MGRQTSSSLLQLRGYLAAGLLRLVGKLPLNWLQALGRGLGVLLWWLPNKSRRITLINLRLCLPQLSDASRERLCQQNLKQTATGLLELPWVWSHPQATLSHVQAVQNGDALRDTLAAGRPAIILAPHLGNWEVLNFWLSEQFDFHAVWLPSGMDALDALIREGREQFRATLHPATARGVASLVRALRDHKGEFASLSGILPDQVPDRRSGQFAPFFGQPAATGTLPVKLIKQTGARAFMAFAMRLPDGNFEIRLRDPEDGVYDDDLDQALPALNRSIEKLVMEAPDQYLWSYQRFRRKSPEGDRPY